MTYKKQRRIIGIFIILSLFFTEMHLHAVPAEDLFAFSMGGFTSESLTPVHSDPYYDAAAAAEPSAIYSVEPRTQAGYRHQCRETNDFLYFLCPAADSVLKGKFDRNHTATYLFCRTQDELITQYVYHSDGKKRL